MINRVFVIVLDSFGVGELPDADKYGDSGSNTLKSCSTSPYFKVNNLKKFGLFNIDGVDCFEKEENPIGCFAKMAELSVGKDTTVGHWELMGLVSDKPFNTFPDGFPEELIRKFEKKTGRGTLCNKPYSGTQVISDYGQEHEKTGKLIVYTSADSVFQIASHEEIVPVPRLYEYCLIARELLNEGYGVNRVIARPFVGSYPNYIRTSNRHDYAVSPPKKTVLDLLKSNNLSVIGVGKINDIFNGNGLTESQKTTSNTDGINKTIQLLKKQFKGLCFTNLVDFDSSFGHRNDVDGYAKALAEFDSALPEILSLLNDDDLLVITADHGCDPLTKSTDHSREYVPLLVYGKNIKQGVNLGVLPSFSALGKTIADIFDLDFTATVNGFFGDIKC